MLSAALFSINTVSAQPERPVQWEFTIKKVDERTYEFHATARMNELWHIYSQSNTGPGSLSVPTSFTFKKNPLFELVGPTKEHGNMREEVIEDTDLKLKYYLGEVSFVQVVKFKQNMKVSTNIVGELKFMACKDEECLPVDNQSFNLALK